MTFRDLALSLIAALTLAGAPSYASSDTSAVVDVLKTVTKAIEAHDLASTDPLWVTDTTFSVIDNGEASYEDWPSFRERVLQPEIEPMKNLKFELANVRPHVVRDLAWITYEYQITAEVKQRPMSVGGAATMVLRRVKGGWKVAHVNIATKRPPPQDASAQHAH